MITCIINGKAAYPAASQSLKITYSNQYISEDGEYSYDISFPMAIMENRRMFHNVSRFDVSKTVKSYDDCKLYVGGRLILSGVGTIIGVSDSEIKLQIVGGKSRVKYNERFSKEYIDEMDLGKAKHGTDFDADQFQELEPLEIAMLLHACSITDMYGFFGFPFATVMGKYVCLPVCKVGIVKPIISRELRSSFSEKHIFLH